MPEKHIIFLVMLHVDVFALHFEVIRAGVAKIDADRHILEGAELEVVLILIELDLHGDHVFALLLGIEHADGER